MKLIEPLIKYKNKTVVFFFLISLFFAQFIVQYQQTMWPKLYLLIVFSAMICLLLFSSLNNEKKIAWNAFICIVILGGANTLIMPIRYNLDENTHYYHVLQIADGNFRNQSDEKNFLMISPDFLAVTKLPSKQEYNSPLNTNLYDSQFRNLKNIPAEYNSKWTNDKSGKINNPAYYPSAIGVFIGRKISNHLMVSYYLGRFFNVFFYAILVFLGISISKKFKIPLFIASTIPYTLWITAGFSYDSLYYGLTIIAISLLVNMYTSKEKTIRVKDVLVYSLVCSAFVFCKAPIALLLLLPMFISKKNFLSSKEKYLSLLPILLGFMLVVLWMKQDSILDFLFSKGVNDSSSTVVNTLNSERLGYFINHPLYTFALLLRSFSDVFVTFQNSISSPWPFINPSQLMTNINFVYFIISLLFLSATLTIQINNFFRVGIVLLFSVITIGIFYAISGDPRVYKLGDLHIGGVQGRYHFYMIPLLPLLLSPSIQKLNLINDLNESKLSVFFMKTSYILLFLNTCVGMYAYL